MKTKKHKGVQALKHFDVGIVVASCDAYSDLWPLIGESFSWFWKDCPWPIYLAANQKSYQSDFISTLLGGEDTDWSSSMRRAIEQTNHKYILLWIDDAFLDRSVDTGRVLEVVERMDQEGWSHIRTRNYPKPSKWLLGGFGRIPEGDISRATICTTIWRREVLLGLLKDGESAWDFEVKGSIRSNAYADFYCVKEKTTFSYIHAVARGAWVPEELRKMHRVGYNVDTSSRSVMSYKEAALRQVGAQKSRILRMIPSRYRGKAMQSIQSFYRFVGLRPAE